MTVHVAPGSRSGQVYPPLPQPLAAGGNGFGVSAIQLPGSRARYSVSPPRTAFVEPARGPFIAPTFHAPVNRTATVFGHVLPGQATDFSPATDCSLRGGGVDIRVTTPIDTHIVRTRSSFYRVGGSFSITALIAGVALALLGFLIPPLFFVGIALFAVGIVLGSIALAKRNALHAAPAA